MDIEKSAWEVWDVVLNLGEGTYIQKAIFEILLDAAYEELLRAAKRPATGHTGCSTTRTGRGRPAGRSRTAPGAKDHRYDAGASCRNVHEA